MANKRCPSCKGHMFFITGSSVKKREYQLNHYECEECQEKLKTYTMNETRAKELLKYEKAYFKMKDLLEVGL